MAPELDEVASIRLSLSSFFPPPVRSVPRDEFPDPYRALGTHSEPSKPVAKALQTRTSLRMQWRESWRLDPMPRIGCKMPCNDPPRAFLSIFGNNQPRSYRR